MDQATLKQDIDLLASLLSSVARLTPQAARLSSYVATIQAVAEQPIILSLLCSVINGIAGQPPQARKAS